MLRHSLVTLTSQSQPERKRWENRYFTSPNHIKVWFNSLEVMYSISPSHQQTAHVEWTNIVLTHPNKCEGYMQPWKFPHGCWKSDCLDQVFHFQYGLIWVSMSRENFPQVWRAQKLNTPPKNKRLAGHQSAVFLLIYEIEISQVITSFHHHIKTWNLTIYFNALFPEVNLFHLNQLAFII